MLTHLRATELAKPVAELPPHLLPQQVTVPLLPALLGELDLIAAEDGGSRNEVIERLLERAVAERAASQRKEPVATRVVPQDPWEERAGRVLDSLSAELFHDCSPGSKTKALSRLNGQDWEALICYALGNPKATNDIASTLALNIDDPLEQLRLAIGSLPTEKRGVPLEVLADLESKCAAMSEKLSSLHSLVNS